MPRKSKSLVFKVKIKKPKNTRGKINQDNISKITEKARKDVKKSFVSTDRYSLSTPTKVITTFGRMKKLGTYKPKRLNGN